MNRFTRAVLAYMLRERGTRKTVAEWLRAEPDREKRRIGFARALREDLLKSFVGELDRRGDIDNELINELLYESLTRVSWERVADELLDRYTPKLLAGYVSTPSIN